MPFALVFLHFSADSRLRTQRVGQVLQATMRLNEKITSRFEITTDRTKADIVSMIEAGKKKGFVTNMFIADAVDYGEFIVADDRIEIHRQPIFVDPFRSSGTIIIEFKSSGNMTVLCCELLPFHGTLPIIVVLGAIGLFLWTFFVLLFGNGLTTFVFLGVSWIMILATASIIFLLTKYGLITYAKRVIKELTQGYKCVY